jgi:hypothetical protein
MTALAGEIIRKVIPAGGRFSTRLETGERLRIVDMHGQQAVDFLCYTAGCCFRIGREWSVFGALHRERGSGR